MFCLPCHISPVFGHNGVARRTCRRIKVNMEASQKGIPPALDVADDPMGALANLDWLADSWMLRR